jgi:hypothetical protein
MQSFVDRDADEPPPQLPLRSLNEALAAERLRLDHRLEQIRNEVSALGEERAGAERRRATVDALLADDAGEDFALSA